jgi:hypothetical protein
VTETTKDAQVGGAGREWVEERRDRAVQSNAMIGAIACCGRQFFRHKEAVSRFDVDDRGRVWFTDKYTCRRVYTHYPGRWRGFTEGGTLRAMVEGMRDFITSGMLLSPRYFGPWPEWVCGGDLWGYGADAMQEVRDAAEQIGIAALASPPTGSQQ